MNFPLFSYVFNAGENLQTFLLFSLFSLLVASFALLFLPYLGKILLTLLILPTAFCVYFIHNFGVIIDTSMLENVLQTDTKKIQELLSFKFLLFVFIVTVLPLSCIYKIQIEFKNPKKQLMLQLTTFLTSLTIAAIIFSLSNAWLIPFLRTHQQIRFFNTPFYQGYSLVKLIKGRYFTHKDFRILTTSASLKNPKDKKLLILVVGETARAQNYSFGGYLKNPTNLYTQSIPNLVFFPNFYACGTSTAISLPCMFSYSKRTQFKTNEFTENILDILQKAGVYITWLSNNSGGCKGVCD
ncbi:phosphoethanolamine transferase domain-containing protein [Helicobacter rodentium]|uniref:phosphoethanolamine transferase domain-containing protein n=1 Tax=Helicobacter rodentium TaxID=59617 RepID=UPI0025580A3F|nr:phosphoethanolamine transferase domain-containing protein [Helicobacter rodentium]